MANEALAELGSSREAVDRVAERSATQIALEAAWEELREDARVDAAYTSYALDRGTLALDIPRGVVPNCRACQDTCCQGPHLVSVRLADCARLVDAQLDAALVRPSRRDREATYERHPALRQVEQRASFKRFPILRQRESGECFFLSSDRRCTIHPIRPLACRAFPFRIDDTLDRVRLSNGCRSFRSDGSVDEVDCLARTTVELFNAKVRDLLFLEHGRRHLEALGFGHLLPPVFADLLQDDGAGFGAGRHPFWRVRH
jgi:Fe-S-cluster containining protein